MQEKKQAARKRGSKQLFSKTRIRTGPTGAAMLQRLKIAAYA